MNLSVVAHDALPHPRPHPTIPSTLPLSSQKLLLFCRFLLLRACLHGRMVAGLHYLPCSCASCLPAAVLFSWSLSPSQRARGARVYGAPPMMQVRGDRALQAHLRGRGEEEEAQRGRRRRQARGGAQPHDSLQDPPLAPSPSAPPSSAALSNFPSAPPPSPVPGRRGGIDGRRRGAVAVAGKRVVCRRRWAALLGGSGSGEDGGVPVSSNGSLANGDHVMVVVVVAVMEQTR